MQARLTVPVMVRGCRSQYKRETGVGIKTSLGHLKGHAAG